MAVKQSHGHCDDGLENYDSGFVYVFVALGEPLKIRKVLEFS